MNVSQLLHELPVVPDVEIVIPFLPEVLGFAEESTRNPLLQGLDCASEHVPLRLAEQQMHMFGHDHVAINREPESASHALQGQFEGWFRAWLIQQRQAMIARRLRVALPIAENALAPKAYMQIMSVSSAAL